MGGSKAQVGGIFDPTQSKRGGRGTFKVFHTRKNFVKKWIILSFLSFSFTYFCPFFYILVFVCAGQISDVNKNVIFKELKLQN